MQLYLGAERARSLRDRLWIVGGILASVGMAVGVTWAPLLAAGVVLGLALFVVTFVEPLAVVGFMLAIGPLDLSFLTGGQKALFSQFGGLDMNGIRLVGVVISLSAIAALDRDVVRHAFERHGRWYLVFLVYAAATILFSPAPLDGMRLLLKLAYPFLFFLAVLGVARRREDVERLADWVLGGAAAITGVVIPILVGVGFYELGSRGLVVQGIGLHQSPLSFYLLIMILVALSRFVMRGQLRYMGLALLLGLWLVLTFTRITFLAAVATLLTIGVFTATRTRDYRPLVAVGVVALAVTVPFTPIVLERSLGFVPSPGEFLGMLTDPVALFQSINTQGRLAIWPVVFQAFLQQPILGQGLGASTAILTASLPGIGATVIHNEYLRLATDTGVVGVLFFTVAVTIWLRACVRAAHSSSAVVRELALPAVAGIVAWAIVALTDNPFDYYAPFTQYIGFLVAAALALHATTGERTAEVQRDD